MKYHKKLTRGILLNDSILSFSTTSLRRSLRTSICELCIASCEFEADMVNCNTYSVDTKV